MRKLLYAALAAASAWSVYWVVGAAATEREVEAWLVDRRDEGWLAEWSAVRTRGFPNRFDTRVIDLALADPDTGLSWEAPFIEVMSLSYEPDHFITALPNSFTLATPLQTLVIGSEEFRGSMIFQGGDDLRLERSRFVLDGVTVTGEDGWQAELDEGLMATTLTDPEANGHRVGVVAEGLKLDEALRARIDPDDELPDTVRIARLDATLAFDAAWDRTAIEVERPQITAIDVAEAEARWGDIVVRAAGELMVDDAGVPTGELLLRAEDWRSLLAVAIASGGVPGRLRDAVEASLELIASLSGGGGDVIEAPLRFENGRMSLGVFPLGPAPDLTIR